MAEWQKAKSEKDAAKKEQVGTTACVALVTDSEIYVANCGDSRCVLGKKGIALQMSIDHKPTLKEEIKRVINAGGKIEEGRVNGVLSLTRSLGDLDFKLDPNLRSDQQAVIAVPEIKVEKRDSLIEFMIIACDGIWDCMTSDGTVSFVNEKMKEKPDKLSKIPEKLFDKILPDEIDENCMFLV